MRVFALIGPSGTGKSHRASQVAYENEVDLIIDDGLLIKESKILAGKSAKREPTLVAAVRRALFSDPDHAAEVRRRLKEIAPERVLILGTSRNMADRIAHALELPLAERVIAIDEVATPQEIRRARRIRREYGKHVIPAPSFEVKKTFSGYLVDPLRFLLRDRSADELQVIEKSVVRPTFSSLGRFFIADTVVGSIAQRAAEEVEGVAKVLTAYIDSFQDGVDVSLQLAVRFGDTIPPLLKKVQQNVRDKVEYTTALNVLSVNVEAKRLSLE